MKIIVNGITKETENQKNLADFVNSETGKSEGFIVELNGRIIRKDERNAHTLQEGDVIEIIQFVGGG